MKNQTYIQHAMTTVGKSALLTHTNLRVSTVFALVLSIASFSIADTALADNLTLYSTGFEQPVFQPGGQLLGVDGWSTAVPPFLNPRAATITQEAASERKQSVVVRGSGLSSAGEVAPYAAVGSYRKPLAFDINDAQSKVHIDADLLLETNQSLTSDEFFSLTIAARSGDGETLGEMGLASNGTVEAWAFNVAPGTIPAFRQPIRFNRWYHLSMLLDYANRTTSYYIDGHLLGTVSAQSTSTNLSRAAMVVYARPDRAGSERSNYTARFDKFRVRVNSAHDQDSGNE